MASITGTSLQAALKAQKRALRKTLAATLDQIPPTSLEEQSQAIASRVLSLPAFAQAKSVSCYLSMPTGEARTASLADAIVQSDKALFVPKIQSTDGTMDFFRVYSAEDLATLPSGVWGIREPHETWRDQQRTRVLGSETQSLDIILVPGVAFDRTFGRLGHGKGFYDRFITSYIASGRSKPLLVGLGLHEQLLSLGQIPMAEHDWRLDLLITPDETLRRESED